MFRNIKLGDIADSMCLSSSRTSAIIKSLTGKTFPELLSWERIARAKILLFETDRQISDIAECVGFENSFYFCNVFTKLVGIAPGRFRRESRKNHHS